MKTTKIVLLALLALVLCATVIHAYDIQVVCPEHHQVASATGTIRFTDGWTHVWAEYRCPGEPGGKPHTFWIETK
jgi:hypothetical protein